MLKKLIKRKPSLTIFSTLIIIISLYFKIPSQIFYKSNNLINKIKLSRLIKKDNCDITVLNEIPNNSSIIIGHLYGSPSQHNNFIDKNAENFLLMNKRKIKNLFLTGDIFFNPSEEKWIKLYSLLDKNIKIIIAPGNHDIGNMDQLKMFNKYTKQSKTFPIIYKDGKKVFIFENSIKSGWHIHTNTIKEIKKINNKNIVFLLRHNIASRELIPLANSKAFLKRDLPYSKEIDKIVNRNIIIISGDGGAFEKLPRFYCRKLGKIKFIINGLGGLEGDSVLVIYNDELFRYILN